MIDLTDRESTFDDSTLRAHVADDPNAALITLTDDDDNALTYAIIRVGHDADVTCDDCSEPILPTDAALYYADPATTFIAHLHHVLITLPSND